MSLRSAAFCCLFLLPFVSAQDRAAGAAPPSPPPNRSACRRLRHARLARSRNGSSSHVPLVRAQSRSRPAAGRVQGREQGRTDEARRTASGSGAATIDAGTYRYTFTIDGVRTNDPKNPVISESVGNTSSVVVVPGAAFMDVSTDVRTARWRRSTTSRPR